MYTPQMRPSLCLYLRIHVTTHKRMWQLPIASYCGCNGMITFSAAGTFITASRYSYMHESYRPRGLVSTYGGQAAPFLASPAFFTVPLRQGPPRAWPASRMATFAQHPAPPPLSVVTGTIDLGGGI